MKKNNIINLLFLILLTILSILVINKGPLYNWDIIPYMTIVKSIENDNIQTISDDIYTELKSKVSEDYYNELVAGNDYRKYIYEHPDALKEQLSFYESKVLYNYINYFFYKCGLELSTATVIINYICYLLIGVTFYILLSIYIERWISLLLTIGIMMTEQVIQLARYSTPDALSTLVLLLVLYFILMKRSLNFIYILLFELFNKHKQ